jgi:hypothetical protein
MVNLPHFDIIVTIHIMLNSIFLAVNLSLDDQFIDNSTWDKIEYYFIIVYTLEAIIKLISWGLYEGRKAYLKEVWNILDGVVVISSLLTLVVTERHFHVIKNIRLFRPLRSVFLLPQLKLLITMLTESLKKLFNLLMLILLLYIFFGAFGINVYNGVLSKRCRENSNPSLGRWEPYEGEITVCGGYYKCPTSDETEKSQSSELTIDDQVRKLNKNIL